MTKGKKSKIVIVDDHLLFSQSLKFLIDSFDGFEVIHQFENGKQFINHIKQNEDFDVDLILMDVNMPVMDGITTMKWLKFHMPHLKAIALSINNEDEVIIKMLKNGARGYLLKDMSPDIFKEALETVISTGFYFTEMVTGILVNKLPEEENSIVLREKEIEFIQLACSEKTYKEIAIEMCLSSKTIDGYRESIFMKLNIKTRVGLVLYAIKNKIFLGDD